MKKPKKNVRVTLQEVADHAGVSTTTASLVVRNNPRISQATRDKVLASMEELGYVYDRVAANMRSQNSNIIGVIVTDIANKFISEFLIGVQNKLEGFGYTVLLGTTFDSVEKQQKLISTMVEHRVDGLILNPASRSIGKTVKQLNNLRIPLVLANRELTNVNADYVGIDYQEGAYKAVNHLVRKGHEKIAFLGGVKKSSTWTERMEGYRMAYENAGLLLDESLIIDSDPTNKGGEEAVLKLLNLPDIPTAIFCFNDLVAFGVMRVLTQKGIVIGRDIDIVGFDNIPEAEIYHPPLTTVSSYPKSIGNQAAKVLHSKIKRESEELQRIILKPQLVIRETSK
ncbi:LacI family DNA-binding transcriptional regulator [Oceanobacillus oncorhynchi subsp. oncorhynchi]|uniref:LacI family DNA-binding transcriptional regulator n=1 Tax=Oceanobacillus oncorhynchi TaxID=545501 RepID=UPI0031DD013C